ncbi:MAG: twin-arginine translocation signal domain-containing protein, partial [Planctomycetes bacterium]|nr:twin-arginine translocation signal domain-containing protein [Planctomycetota bacterium]
MGPVREEQGMTISRRDFVRTAAGVAAVGLGGGTAGMGQTVQEQQSGKRGSHGPIIIS